MNHPIGTRVRVTNDPPMWEGRHDKRGTIGKVGVVALVLADGLHIVDSDDPNGTPSSLSCWPQHLEVVR